MRLTRSKAIRAKCLDCCGNNRAEVRRCGIKKCPLYPYRLGREEKQTEQQEDIDLDEE